MAQDHDAKTTPGPAVTERQPPTMWKLFAALGAARRHLSLYGMEHHSTDATLSELSALLEGFTSELGPVTFVFAQDAVIANEHSYTHSEESADLCKRLRVRGAMAVTLVGTVGAEQVRAFLSFLNTEPGEIRTAGGASAYLRKHGVSRIAATDATYGGADPEEDRDSTPEISVREMDEAVASAINWLLRQDKDKEESPRLPIAEVLSQPDQAAKLIREAITKLHASRREQTEGELACEVVHGLKGLAVSSEEWDEATPQIRKAVSKLPMGIRPEMSGFTADTGRASGQSAAPVADAGAVEEKISEILEESDTSTAAGPLPAPATFDSLFGASPQGLMSSWRRELQPEMVLESSGKTLETLMTQETKPTEHERIAQALADLIPRAVEMKDFRSAQAIAESLITEMNSGSPSDWRCMDAKVALQSLDVEVMRPLVKALLATDNSGTRQTAAAIAEALPRLAIQMIGVFGASGAGFADSLARGVLQLGDSAIAPLGTILREGAGESRELALEVLVGMRSAAAIREVTRSLTALDPLFAIRALDRLSGLRAREVREVCISYLEGSSPEMRLAALRALGRMGDPEAIPAVTRVAMSHGIRSYDVTERVQAVKTLGQIGSDEASGYLHRIAERQPIFGKRKYGAIRGAAQEALAALSAKRKAA